MKWLILNDAKAAKVIIEGEACFAELFGQERTIAEVAKKLEMKLNAVAYRVERMMDVGILKIVRTVKQRGRSVNVYTTVTDKLFMPFDMTPEQTLESLLLKENKLIEATVTNAILNVKDQLREASGVRSWGIRLYRDKHGELQGDLAVSPERVLEFNHKDAPVLLDKFTSSLMLNFEDAKAFQKELEALEKKYAAKGGSQRYVFRLVLVRVDSSSKVKKT